MKKAKSIIISLLILAIVIGGCIGAYWYFTKPAEDTEVSQNTENTENDKLAKIDKTPIFSLGDYPKVDASLATQPLTTAFVKNFTGADSEVTDEYLDYTNTHPAYLRLVDGEVDLIVVTEPSADELDYAKQKNVELEVIPVVKEGFVFYVIAENEVSNLKLEEIQKIYTGEIRNWNEVGGVDEKIRPIQRPANSGSQTGMLSLVMKDKKIMQPETEDLIETMSEIINIVSDYDNGLNSIGYSYYYYATTMYDTIDSNVADRIKLLSIDGVYPNNETIKNGAYPLQTSYYIVIRKDEEQGSNTRKLVDSMLSARGQAIAEEVGYVRTK